MSNRNITAVLRDIDTVEKSKHLNEAQKNHAISMFKKELDALTGQGQIEMPAQPGTAPSRSK